MPNKIVRITAFPRIHISLIGMSTQKYRINGGAGFALNKPELNFTFTTSEEFVFEDYRTKGFTSVEKDRIKERIEKIVEKYSFRENIKCCFKSEVPTHCGFGSSTITYLACIEALFILNNHEYTPDLIKNISGRGGTSGIGINSYFNGGYFLDIGRKRTNSENDFTPSSISDNRKSLPLKLVETKMPDWDIFVFIPDIKLKNEEEEISFFKSACPIKTTETFEILYECVYGITAGIIENDKSIFSEAINNVQLKEWKNKETSLYGDKVHSLIQELNNRETEYVGMSSLGPTIYFGIKDNNNKKNILKYLSNKGLIIQTKPNNTGRIIHHD